MTALPTPTRTPRAHVWRPSADRRVEQLQGLLLATVDGHRNVVELESVARALGLAPDALERLCRDGLIELRG